MSLGPGMIEGDCRDCGTVLYSRTTATACHDAGKWMRCARPAAYSFIDREEYIARHQTLTSHPLDGDE